MTDDVTPDSATDPAGTPTPEAGTPAVDAPATPDLPAWAKDPVQAHREVEKARAEAAAARTKARDAAKADAKAELLKELGLVQADETPDPAKAAADLATARTQATDAARELAIFRAAPAGTDVNALLDSRSFLATVASIDPTDTAALAAAIGQAITNTPRLKTGQAPASSGTDIPGGQAPVRTYTRAQLRDPAFYQANKADIDLALVEGRIN